MLFPSVSQIVIARMAEPSISQQSLWMLAAVPFGSFLITMSTQLRMSGRWRRLSIRRTNELFLVLGTAFFALVMATGLLALKVGDVRWTLSTLAPALSLVSIGVMGIGLIIHQRLGATYSLQGGPSTPELRGGKFAAPRLAGTSLIPLGAIGMLVAVGLA